MEYNETNEELHYGNTGLAARFLFKYYELILMFLAGVVFGGVMAPLLIWSAGIGAAISLVTFTAAGIGATIIAVQLVE